MAKKPAYEFNNLTKAQQDCLTLIESLGIYELRALARVFGDNSPTTLKRDDHISIVMEKIISGEDLKPLPLRQGRPYKELSNIEGILAELSQITGKNYSATSNQNRSLNRSAKVVTFRQIEEDVIKQRLFPIEVRGILRERTNKDLFFVNIDNGKSVLIKRDFDDRLKPYDYVTGTAVIMNEEKEYILESLKTINYQNEKDYIDTINPYICEIATEKLKVGNTELTLGSRYLIKQSRFAENVEKIKSLVEKLQSQKVITLALIPNVMFEDMLTLKSIGFDSTFILKYEDSPVQTYELMQNLLEHIISLQKSGKKVALFVEDTTTLANSIDFCFKNTTKALMGHTENAVEMIKNYMMLAKSGGKNKNTTLFLTFDDVDMFDATYVSSIYKVSKKLDI